jgi:ATP phosphoribosyltransferase
MANVLKIGIPKGSLQESTLALFSAAGFSFRGSERSLRLSSNDPEIEPVLLRPQEIPVFVSRGNLDCGLAGLDWILETRSGWFKDGQFMGPLHLLADLQYSKQSFRPVKWVLAVPDDSPCRKTDDLKTLRAPVRVSTELKWITENWLSKKGIIAEVDFSWGATEAKAGDFANAIVECTETGASLRANRLRILDDVLVSTTQFFAYKPICIQPKESDRPKATSKEEEQSKEFKEQVEEFQKQVDAYKQSDWKRTKLAGIALLLKSCLAADAKVNVRVLAPLLKAEVIEALIPSSVSYSVWNGKKDEVLFDLIMDKASVRELVPVFARNGATKITGAKLDMFYE